MAKSALRNREYQRTRVQFPFAFFAPYQMTRIIMKSLSIGVVLTVLVATMSGCSAGVGAASASDAAPMQMTDSGTPVALTTTPDAGPIGIGAPDAGQRDAADAGAVAVDDASPDAVATAPDAQTADAAPSGPDAGSGTTDAGAPPAVDAGPDAAPKPICCRVYNADGTTTLSCGCNGTYGNDNIVYGVTRCPPHTVSFASACQSGASCQVDYMPYGGIGYGLCE